MDIKSEIFGPSERSRILQAAANLGAEQGYAETTIEDVIDHSGVSAERFAQIFGGEVEECVLAAFNAIVAEVMSAVVASYSADRSELDSALLGMKALLELMAANPSFAHLGYIVSRQMASPRVHETYDASAGLLAAMLDRLREQSIGFEPPAKTSRSGLGGAEAVVRAELMAGRAEQLPRLLPDLAYGATVGFLGQEEALRLAARGRQLLRGTPWDNPTPASKRPRGDWEGLLGFACRLRGARAIWEYDGRLRLVSRPLPFARTTVPGDGPTNIGK